MPAAEPLARYLRRFAEPEAALAAQVPDAFEAALVIPAFAEPPEFVERLFAELCAAPAFLLILVVNQPDDRPADAATAALWASLGGGDAPWHYARRGRQGLLAVDRFRSGHRIPKRQGVGLARKIGADIAIALRHAGQLARPWIWNSDADARLPAGYFDALAATPAQRAGLLPDAVPAACLYPFRHRIGPDALGTATAFYEASIRHYAAGLHWAGSPYAFATLGSTIAVDAEAYAGVRGFPRRNGGEDFYLLDKLAKLGAIHELPGPEIELAARESQRVPFGTGPAVARILAAGEIHGQALFRHPQAFAELRRWLALFPELRERDPGAADLAPETREALAAQGVDQALAHARDHAAEAAGFARHLHTWFDGLRTLRLLNALRARWPDVDAETAARGPF
jgi:hypothetical protein